MHHKYDVFSALVCVCVYISLSGVYISVVSSLVVSLQANGSFSTELWISMCFELEKWLEQLFSI